MVPHVTTPSFLALDTSFEALRDVQPYVALIAGLLSHPTPLSAPLYIQKCLSHVVGQYSGLLKLETS